jgi:hypothetical protein
VRQGLRTAIQVGALVPSLGAVSVLSAAVFDKTYLIVFPLMATTILSPGLLAKPRSSGGRGEGGRIIELGSFEEAGPARRREAA